jgi:hypothetical protein
LIRPVLRSQFVCKVNGRPINPDPFACVPNRIADEVILSRQG